MATESPAEVIGRRIAAIGTTVRRVQIEAGMGADSTYVRDILRGKSRMPTGDRLAMVLSALDRLEVEVGGPDGSRGPGLCARRFAAARWACFGDNKALACSRDWLNLDGAVLDAIERGVDVEPGREILERMRDRFSIPVAFFLEGSWDGMPGDIGGRIAVRDRGLVPDYPAALRQ